MYNTGSPASGAAALLLVALLTLPSVISLVSHFRELKTKPARYEDKDGVASEESVAKYTARSPKILLSLFTVLGLATAIALVILGILNRGLDPRFLENWLAVAEWVRRKIAASPP